MSLPDVNIELANGALGAVADGNDGIAALVTTGVAATGLALATPKVIFSLAEAEGLGITAALNPAAYRHIKEFYAGYRFITNSDTAELYIMMLVNTVTLTQMLDVTTTAGAKQLLNYAGGRVRLLAAARTPAGGYTPVVTDGVDADCLTALGKAHELGNSFAARQAPIRCLVEGRAFAYANVGNLKDLKTYAYPRAGLVLWSTQNDGSSSVAFALGVKAGLAVQRKISRVKNGIPPISNPYIGDVAWSVASPSIGAMHDKGYITLRSFPTRSGYYFTGEPMATAATDDYAILSHGCVIDKAQRIAYDTYLDELEDDVEVDSAGQLIDGYKAYVEHRIVKAISLQMAGEISGTPSFNILPGQNILANSTTNVVLGVTPKGYQSQINIKLGFQNPANQ